MEHKKEHLRLHIIDINFTNFRLDDDNENVINHKYTKKIEQFQVNSQFTQ